MITDVARSDIAVVVPAYDAVATIRECIDSLVVGNGLDPSTVVMVDNGSKDDTVAVASAMGVRVVHCVERGPAAARNAGLDFLGTTSPTYVLFLDSDARLDAGWVEDAVEFLGTHPEHAAVGGLARSNGHRLAERALDASLWGLSTAQQHPVDVDTLATMAALFRWDAVAERRFDTGLITGEDPEFAFSLREDGWRLAVDPALKLIHHNPERVADVWRKWYSYGRSYPVAYMRYPSRRGPGFTARMAALPLLMVIVAVSWLLAGPRGGVGVPLMFLVALWMIMAVRFRSRGACSALDALPIAFVHIGKVVAHQMGIWFGLGYWWRRRHTIRGGQCAS